MSTQDINVKQQPAVAATGGGTDTLLATEQLTKKFGGLTAVDSVDFSIAEGEIRCLIGPVGADETPYLALGNREVDAVDGGEAAELLR